MSNLGNLLSLVINVIFIFATVSFVASATTEAISGTLKWRETRLLRGVKTLLNDPTFTGLARDIYNNPAVNSQAVGDVQTEAQLQSRPNKIDPKAFATALLEILHVVPSKISDPEISGIVDPPTSIDEATNNAVNVISYKMQIPPQVAEHLSEPERKKRETAQKQILELVKNMIIRHGRDRNEMETAVANWFTIGMAHVVDEYIRLTQLSNIIIAVVIAALLDLKPIPIGGFGALLDFGPAPPSVPSIAGLIPTSGPIAAYGIRALEWGIIGLSTLAGGQFWYNILKSVSGQPSGGPAAGGAGPAAGGGAGPAAGGGGPAAGGAG
jgi:hypothetical protein